jgi:hypothetical protein
MGAIIKKLFVILFFIALSSNVFGGDGLTKNNKISVEERNDRCLLFMRIYGSVADSRNHGHLAQTTMNMAEGFLKGNPWLDRETIKAIVNKVYFDPSFRSVGGLRFEQQIFNICFTGEDPFNKPAK